jgi:leucyl/phenylalanyl-tRNA--protein transferase
MDDKNLEEKILQPYNMLALYSKGAFPMGNDEGDIDWYMPNIRCIIPLNDYNIPRSLKKFMQTCGFSYDYDKRQLEVIEYCSRREKTWINDKLKNAYKGLYGIGCLRSVETYDQNGELIGGLYGISYKGCFFGESMFSLKPQASKCALVKLIERLIERNYVLLDVQFWTPHLAMFGARVISFDKYFELLQKGEKIETKFS